MSADVAKDKSLPESLVWLADAPLFIDETQIERFYDAVIKPESETGTTTLEIDTETAKKISGKLGMEVSVEPGKFASILAPVFAFLKPQVKAAGEASGEAAQKTGSKKAIQLHPIVTPQRQLVNMTLYYLLNQPDRLFLKSRPSDLDWRDQANILKVPRQLVFLDLPGQDEAKASGTLAETKLIPTAAEFENGRIILLYDRLSKQNGERPPRYPEKAGTLEELREKRKEYWRWFDENYNATQAMVVVEEAASENGRIKWIDYRMPLTKAGETLHLHVCPAGKYDTGVLAYNFIKRGYKHGIRLIGTLRSEPDMNVLAIYDK